MNTNLTSATQQIKDTIFQLFDQGAFKKAILGDEDFFFRDDLWGNHNSSNVIDYFFEWYLLKGTKESLLKLEQFFIDEIQQKRKINEIDKGLISLSLVRFYCREAQSKNNWLLKKDFILQLLFDCISRYNNEELITLNIQRDIKTLEKYLPEAKEVSDEINKRLGIK